MGEANLTYADFSLMGRQLGTVQDLLIFGEGFGENYRYPVAFIQKFDGCLIRLIFGK